MKYKTTILAISVHHESENPVYGENATHIRVEDDAGGPYLILSQSRDVLEPGEIGVDFAELDAIHQAAQVLRKQFPEE
jgi:hypothetical protein